MLRVVPTFKTLFEQCSKVYSELMHSHIDTKQEWPSPAQTNATKLNKQINNYRLQSRFKKKRIVHNISILQLLENYNYND